MTILIYLMANTERNKERQKDKVIVMQILKENCGNNLVIGELLPYMYSCYAVLCTISFSALLVGNIVGRGSFLLKKFMACLLDKVRSAVCCLRICLQLVPSHSPSPFFPALSLSLFVYLSLSHTFDICHFCGQIENCKKSVSNSSNRRSSSATWQLDILFECNGHI